MKNSLFQKELESRAVIESETVYEGEIFSVRHDILNFESKPPHDWFIVVHPGAVAAIPINADGKLVLIKQWRRAIEQIIYEIPAGTLDKGESPLDCIDRELQEEIGYRAKTLIPLGGYYPTPGFCDEYVHLYIAKDLSESSLPKDIHEAIDVVEVELEEALALIDSNQIQDGKTVAGILRYARWLNA